jgi:hypothetical protein
MMKDGLERRGGEQTLSLCRGLASRPYLLISRVSAYDSSIPSFEDEKTFMAGSMVVENFVVELKTGKVLTSFGVTGKPASTITYKVGPKDFAAGNAMTEAGRTMVVDAQRNLSQAITASGGRFKQ